MFNGKGDGAHTSIWSNLLATAIFCIPIIYCYFAGFLAALALYSMVLIYSMVASISRIKWENELSHKAWDNFYDCESKQKINKKQK